MRDIKGMEKELEALEAKVAKVKEELANARLAKFLQDSGAKEGEPPIFINSKKELVLVNGHDGMFPFGNLIKKNGEVSTVTRYLYSTGGFSLYTRKETK